MLVAPPVPLFSRGVTRLPLLSEKYSRVLHPETKKFLPPL